MKARLPSDLRWQCPLCGAPVSEAEVVKTPGGDRGVVFDCCGNVVTYACLRDAFGIDIEGDL